MGHGRSICKTHTLHGGIRINIINATATNFIQNTGPMERKELTMATRAARKQKQSKTQTEAAPKPKLIEEKKKQTKPKKKKFDEDAFYVKYSHVVKGSIQEIERGIVPLATGVQSHGRICIIACEICGEHRTINIQDAFQTRFCITHQKERAKEKAREKRKAKKNK
jgi:hypothetical protein